MNFRKFLLAAAVVALLFAGTAAAQLPQPPPPPVCNIYGAVTPTVRAEGMAELTGDIGIACMQYGEFPLPVQLDLRVTLNVAVTNPRDFGAGPDVTDAQLFTIEQVPCPPCGPPSVTGPAYGRLLSNNRLQWLVTAVIPPGTMGQQVYLQIVNIRAQAYGAPSPGPGIPGAITASIELGPGSTPVSGLPFYGLYLAYATPGLIPSLETGPEVFRVRLAEGNPTAFKPLGVPVTAPGGAMVFQENGYYVPGLGANGGGATQGTRFLIRFVDIPGGVKLLVPHRIQVAPPGVPGGYPIEVRRVFGADSSGFGGCYYLGCLTPPPPGTLGLVEDSKGTGVAVYEFVGGTPYTGDVFDVPVLACRGKVSEYGECRQILPPALLRNLAVRASLAPVTTTPGWYSGAPIPRFVEVGIQTPLP